MMSRYSTRLFLSCLIGTFSLLTHSFLSAEPQGHERLDLALEHSVDGIQCNTSNLDPTQLISQTLRSRRHHRCDPGFILYQADLSECRIAIEDRSQLGLTADFVTAFGGDDFSCSPLPGKGIEVTPRNGVSFTKSVPPEGVPGPAPFGNFDHVKFLAYSVFAEAPLNRGELCTTWVGSGKQLNVDNNPFDGAVTHPHDDPRLSSVGFVGLDPTSLSTFDWICTDETIYAVVERLPGAEALFGGYAAFTYLIPVGKRDPNKDPLDDVHTFQTCFNRSEGTVQWILDGRPVFKITQIGHRLTSKNAFVYKCGKPKPLSEPDQHKVADHGGVNQDVKLIGLQTGIALFTLLDFYPTKGQMNPTNIGLTRLASNEIRAGTGGLFYNDPHAPVPGIPAVFFADSQLNLITGQYEQTIPSIFRLFGQGAILRLFDYTVSIRE